MATQYHIYSNGTSGGPINYGTVVATVAGTTWTSGALPVSTLTRFGVRAFDTASNLEESNVGAVVAITTDANGNDISKVPLAPILQGATATAGGTASVYFMWPVTPKAGDSPVTFRVYLSSGSTVDYTQPPVATLMANAPQSRFGKNYFAAVSGLSDGTTYSIGVRASNAVGQEKNTNQVRVVGSSTPPADVDSLSGSAVF